MKRLSIPKALMLSLGLALTLLVPKTTNAQYGESAMFDWESEDNYYAGDGYAFDGVADGFESLFDDIRSLQLSEGSLLGQMRGEVGINLSIANDDFNAPLGSGIVILLGAGLGYAALKKKEEEL